MCCGRCSCRRDWDVVCGDVCSPDAAFSSSSGSPVFTASSEPDEVERGVPRSTSDGLLAVADVAEEGHVIWRTSSNPKPASSFPDLSQHLAAPSWSVRSVRDIHTPGTHPVLTCADRCSAPGTRVFSLRGIFPYLYSPAPLRLSVCLRPSCLSPAPQLPCALSVCLPACITSIVRALAAICMARRKAYAFLTVVIANYYPCLSAL